MTPDGNYSDDLRDREGPVDPYYDLVARRRHVFDLR